MKMNFLLLTKTNK